ncbi:LysR family transcriptional regulator [Clostridium boliviensis]|uniref:LysR family transcriptional regulator n=2 Tax=Clostridia TaxID=186801 RepID=A0ABU4GNU7_9CLOT|nr:LysR family transcriptional regulator [Clostridium boliviensis]MDW2799276.1 LysR family transcriptional regulator [Clostridium boliviensis]
MDTRYLTYILTIAKKENMTKAAEELFVSQSTLSQYLSKLESELGTPLFYRSKGRLTLTPAGSLYIEAAKKVMSIKNVLYQNIQNIDNRGHITVGVTSQFGLDMLTDIIPAFKSQYPDIIIEISETNLPSLTKMILEESIDCGIMAMNEISPFSPDQVSILKKEEVLFSIPVNHPYRKINPDKPIGIREFAKNFGEENILLSKKGSTLRHLTDMILEDAGWIPSTVCETNSISTTRSMVAMGIGVTFISESCSSDREHVAYYSVEPTLTRLNALVTRKNWVQSHASQYLCDSIKNYFH